MKRLLTLDAWNYPPDMPELRRNSVRGIIFVDGKLLLVESDSGEVKLPGGGVEAGEGDCEALMREVKEETGFSVIVKSIVPFGEILEKRLSDREPMIWHHTSRLYFCDVHPGGGPCAYTENERRHGFHSVLCTLEEAIEKNRCMLSREGCKPWNQREYETLLLIRSHLSGKRRPYITL